VERVPNRDFSAFAPEGKEKASSSPSRVRFSNLLHVTEKRGERGSAIVPLPETENRSFFRKEKKDSAFCRQKRSKEDDYNYLTSLKGEKAPTKRRREGVLYF